MRREWADKAPFIDTTNGALRDVAQLVARVLWEHDAAGSSPVISTKKLQEKFLLELFYILLIF